MIEKVAEFLKKYDIKKKTVLAAVSGGVDSVVLLHILNSLKNEFSLDIKVIHLNHNWRGEASQGDMEFVQSLANDMGLEFYCDTLDDDIKKTELCARDARYSFFVFGVVFFVLLFCFYIVFWFFLLIFRFCIAFTIVVFTAGWFVVFWFVAF